jgi:hypothetical protein
MMMATLRELYKVSTGSSTDAYLTSLEALFTKLFAQGNSGLRQIDANVGPAIARTMLRYCSERGGGFLATPAIASEELFVEAESSGLFPQYEGRRMDHEKISDAIIGVLPESAKNNYKHRINDSLSVWTGNRN